MKKETRLRYTVTSDYNDLPKKIEFELNFFLEKTSIDGLLKTLIKDLKNRNIDYEDLLLELHNTRNELAKLDMLLGECSDIFEACTAPVDVPASTELVETKLKPEEPAAVENPAAVSQALDYSTLQGSMNQLRDMAKNLKTMKQDTA